MSKPKSPQHPPEQLPEPADRPRRRHSLLASFGFASQGIWYALRSQRNFRIQLTAGLLAAIAAAWMDFSRVEWAVLILTIAAVLILELLNTVVETVVDMISPEYHPLAKIAKDVAAAAVLMASIAAVVIGVLLFLIRH